MKIGINNIKNKLDIYFKEKLDQTVVIAILIIIITNALFASILFYFVTLNHKVPALEKTDYKEIKIKVKEGVLEKLERREEINRETQAKIDSLEDPFKME